MFTRTHFVVAAWLVLGWPGWLPAAPAPAPDRPHVFLITIDFAPTLARLLGRELPGADGKVLEGLLAAEGGGR